MSRSHPFKWRHYEGEVILLCVRWYLRYALNYRDLEEMMQERGLSVDHTTIYRWVQRYVPELDRRCRAHLKPTNDSYRLEETYIKIKGKWKYLYRAVDSAGQTLEFLLTAQRDSQAAQRFFRQLLNAFHTATPRVITVDKHAAYPRAFADLQQAGQLPDTCTLRHSKYLNNIIEQDHRVVKRLTRPMLGFHSFRTAWRTLRDIEMRRMLCKGQIHGVGRGDSLAQSDFVAELFGLAA